jgi:SAM-dependent methyltransferase
MNYTKANKEAWEEAFEKHKKGWKTDPAEKLLEGNFVFLDKPVIAELKTMNLTQKTVGQFCCNNGREVLSIVKLGAESGIGFDISENFINEARRIAEKSGLNCQFVATDIYDIPSEYHNTFDLLFISVGALCWFSRLHEFFRKASDVLKDNGILLVHEGHPFTNMLALPGEEAFIKDNPEKLAYSYFKTDPWVETSGIDYIGKTTYKSKPLYSFSHKFSDIITAIAQNGFLIQHLTEYNIDISAEFEHFNNQKIPLSYLLKGKKLQSREI